MKNLVQGKFSTVLQWTNGTGTAVASGDPVLLGDQGLHGVALEDIANTASGSVGIPGGMVISFPVKGHDGTSNAAIAAYDKVYFAAGAAFMDVHTADTNVGFVLSAVSSGATTTSDVLIRQA